MIKEDQADSVEDKSVRQGETGEMSGGVTRKLKILCIHGYRQNEQSFRERTGAFRKIPIIKKSTELVFVSAPNVVPPLPGEDGEKQEETTAAAQRGWWFSKADDSYVAQDRTNCCKGYDESLKTLETVFKEQGPFDGIISFSQGAALAALLCCIQEKDPGSVFKFQFVILVAGFRSRQSSHQSMYDTKITIPSLHVFGETDKVIQKEMSEDLLPCFTAPKVLQHEGGHFIPVGGGHKKIYTEFLTDMLAKVAT